MTEMYLGLHVGSTGNVGSTERLDFTVVGSAVNEASRIAAMCCSVDQPILLPRAFASVGGIRERIVSVGRYVLRGVAQAFHARPDRVELARGLRYATHAFTSRLLIQRWRRSRRRTSIA